MKKWLFFILLVITAAGTFIPCCREAGCCATEIAATPTKESHQKEGTCSPFFACATCSCSIEIAKPFLLKQPVAGKPLHHESLAIGTLSNYTTSCWQPPRSC